MTNSFPVCFFQAISRCTACNEVDYHFIGERNYYLSSDDIFCDADKSVPVIERQCRTCRNEWCEWTDPDKKPHAPEVSADEWAHRISTMAYEKSEPIAYYPRTPWQFDIESIRDRCNNAYRLGWR